MNRQSWAKLAVIILLFIALMVGFVLPAVNSIKDTLHTAQAASHSAQDTARTVQAMAGAVQQIQAAVNPDSDAAKNVRAEKARKEWCAEWQSGNLPWDREAGGPGWFLDLPGDEPGKHYDTRDEARAEAQRLAEQYGKGAGC